MVASKHDQTICLATHIIHPDKLEINSSLDVCLHNNDIICICMDEVLGLKIYDKVLYWLSARVSSGNKERRMYVPSFGIKKISKLSLSMSIWSWKCCAVRRNKLFWPGEVYFVWNTLGWNGLMTRKPVKSLQLMLMLKLLSRCHLRGFELGSKLIQKMTYGRRLYSPRQILSLKVLFFHHPSHATLWHVNSGLDWAWGHMQPSCPRHRT